MAAILPSMDQNALYRSLDLKKAWAAKENARFTKLNIPSYLNPGFCSNKSSAGQTHYVGIAGVGKGAELLALPNARAGMFGYNRKTRFRDITDGTANTMMVTEASKNFGSWGAGGKVTIRALTTKPYINGPDGIGGPFNGGCNVLFADGSVRFISKNINSNIFESLSTIQGGEVVGGF